MHNIYINMSYCELVSFWEMNLSFLNRYFPLCSFVKKKHVSIILGDPGNLGVKDLTPTTHSMNIYIRKIIYIYINISYSMNIYIYIYNHSIIYILYIHISPVYTAFNCLVAPSDSPFRAWCSCWCSTQTMFIRLNQQSIYKVIFNKGFPSICVHILKINRRMSSQPVCLPFQHSNRFKLMVAESQFQNHSFQYALSVKNFTCRS